jgi:antitoxin component YwqK of YwqJK toxin-antitoxin module
MNQKINGLKEGYWEDYYTNGNLMYKGHYKNGFLDGYWEWYYYSNGNLNYKGHYKNGIRDGYWELYYSNGNLETQEIFI